MNKVFFAILCVSSSFLCSMENPSTKLSIIQPDSNSFKITRSRMPSNPIERVRRQSLESPMFVKHENSPMFAKEKEHYKIGQQSSDSDKK